jgi:hypothetical protein
MRLAALIHHAPKAGVLALTLAIATVHAQPQFTPPPHSAAISGTVTDVTNAVIPGAAVSLKAAEGFTLKTKTGLDGQFAIDAGPGEYTLNISAQGFKTLSEPISLGATTNLTRHVVLPIAESGCPVCVTPEPHPIQLEIPSYTLAAMLPLKPLPPLKLHRRGLKKSRKVT